MPTTGEFEHPAGGPATTAALPEVSVRVPGPLREQAGGNTEVRVRATSVTGALAGIADAYPAMRRHLFREDGALRGYVNVYVNETDTRDCGGLAAALVSGDVVTIVPSIAGG